MGLEYRPTFPTKTNWNVGKYSIHGAYMSIWVLVHPRKLTWQWNIHHEWRCISYWKCGIFHCHVSFPGSKFPYLTSPHIAFFGEQTYYFFSCPPRPNKVKTKLFGKVRFKSRKKACWFSECFNFLGWFTKTHVCGGNSSWPLLGVFFQNTRNNSGLGIIGKFAQHRHVAVVGWQETCGSFQKIWWSFHPKKKINSVKNHGPFCHTLDVFFQKFLGDLKKQPILR